MTKLCCALITSLGSESHLAEATSLVPYICFWTRTLLEQPLGSFLLLIPPIRTYHYHGFDHGYIYIVNGTPSSGRYWANGSAYAQQKLGDRWLVGACTIALNCESLTDPHDAKVVKEVLLLYVLHS